MVKQISGEICLNWSSDVQCGIKAVQLLLNPTMWEHSIFGSLKTHTKTHGHFLFGPFEWSTEVESWFDYKHNDRKIIEFWPIFAEKQPFFWSDHTKFLKFLVLRHMITFLGVNKPTSKREQSSRYRSNQRKLGYHSVCNTCSIEPQLQEKARVFKKVQVSHHHQKITLLPVTHWVPASSWVFYLKI